MTGWLTALDEVRAAMTTADSDIRRSDRVDALDQLRLGASELDKAKAGAAAAIAELQAAHTIILNALAVMTDMQKIQWARANARDGVDISDGITRYHQRAEVIKQAREVDGTYDQWVSP